MGGTGDIIWEEKIEWLGMGKGVALAGGREAKQPAPFFLQGDLVGMLDLQT